LDFEALRIRVSKRARTNKETARGRTKAGRARFVHMEANLLPLLRSDEPREYAAVCQFQSFGSIAWFSRTGGGGALGVIRVDATSSRA
jgi:hypothetical protein